MTPATNKLSNIAPFSIRDPFELDSPTPSLVPPVNSTANHRSHHQQNDLYRFDGSHGHHRHSHPHQQQQYALPINSSTTNSSSYPSHKLSLNPSVFTQFKIHPDRMPSSSPSSSAAAYNCCRYPPTAELALPTPVSPLPSHTSSPSIITPHTSGTSSRKTKVNIAKKRKEKKITFLCLFLSMKRRIRIKLIHISIEMNHFVL